MIDYDKLKHAHDLTEKYYEQTKIMTWIKIIVPCISDLIGYQWTTLHDCLLKCEDIDELIAKLEEMTKPEQKYALNSTVYALDGFNGIIELTIVRSYVTGIDTTITIYVTDLGARYAESELYPTREALIEAQVEYWQKLRCQGGGHAYDTDSSICLYCDTKQFSQPPKFEGKVEGFTPETVKVRGVERAVSEFNSCTHERDESKERKLMYTPSEMGWVYVYACKHCKEYYLCD